MNKNTIFFERILQIIDYYGIKNVNIFAKDYLGYTSSEKINRLKDDSKKPSFEILDDISNKFENIDMNWLITGHGFMLKDSNMQKIKEVKDNQGFVGQMTGGSVDIHHDEGAVRNYGTIKNVGDNTGIGQMSGGCVHDNEINNYHGLTRDDLVTMMEERFQHMLKKEEDIRNIFEENRKLTDEMLRQNDEFRRKNDDYREAVIHIKALMERINQLTDKLINNQ